MISRDVYFFGNACAFSSRKAVSVPTSVIGGLGAPWRPAILWLRHDWAIFQCRWKARFDAQPEQSARQPIARNGKVIRRAYSWRALDCEKTTMVLYAFSHRGALLCLRWDWGKRGDLTWQPAVKHQNPPAKTTNSKRCDRAQWPAQVKEHKPEQPGWKYSKYWANIEKRNQINTRNYWK